MGLACFIYPGIINLIKAIISFFSGSSVLDFTEVDKFLITFYRIFENFKGIIFTH